MAISQERRQRILERDGWQCRMPVCLCPDGKAIDRSLDGSRMDWAPSVDHIVQKCFGGPTSDENLRAAHQKCNNSAAQPGPGGPGGPRSAMVSLPPRAPGRKYRIEILEEPAAVLGGPRLIPRVIPQTGRTSRHQFP